jgi:hypothetical protein
MMEEIIWTQHFVNDALVVVVVVGVSWPPRSLDLSILQYLLAGHRNSRF